MDIQTVQTIDIGQLSEIAYADFIENEFAIFDDIMELAIDKKLFRPEFAIFAICTAGSARLKINYSDIVIKENSLLVILPDSVVELVDAESSLKCMYIVVSAWFMEEVLPKLDRILPLFFYVTEHPCISISPMETNRIVEFHSFLRSRVEHHDIAYRKEIAISLLKVLFYDVNGIIGTHLSDNHTSRKDFIFGNFLQILAQNYKKERRLEFYADKLCVTAKYLSLVAKYVSHKTAGEWIDDYVVTEAKSMLRNTTLSVQEIAYELNFPNPSFFGKFFKRKTGTTPGSYRESGF